MELLELNGSYLVLAYTGLMLWNLLCWRHGRQNSTDTCSPTAPLSRRYDVSNFVAILCVEFLVVTKNLKFI